MDGFVVQEMVAGGVEMLVGVAHDPLFGPVVAVGAGGTTVELLRDVAIRLTPISDLDANEMVRSLGTFPLLDGFRGAPKVDVPALEEVILRVGALADSHPAVAEMDCNPVTVLPVGAVIVDARVRVREAPSTKPLGARARAACAAIRATLATTNGASSDRRACASSLAVSARLGWSHGSS